MCDHKAGCVFLMPEWEALYDVRQAIRATGCDVTEDPRGQVLFAMLGPETMARVEYQFGGTDGDLWLLDDPDPDGEPEILRCVHVRCPVEVADFVGQLQEHIRARYEEWAAEERYRSLVSGLRELLLSCATSEEKDWPNLVRHAIPELCVGLLAKLGDPESTTPTEWNC